MNEWKCIDLECTHWDGDRCALGFCEPDIPKQDRCPECGLTKKYHWYGCSRDKGNINED